MLNNIDLRLNALALNVISAARNNLTSAGNGGDLSNSLRYEIDYKNNNIVLTFYGTDYASFHDKGVQGANPTGLPKNSKWYGINKAPNSPFRFGSGTGKKGGLRGAIDRWVVSKPIMDARNAKGEFIKRKSLVFLISRNIYLSGLKATDFFSKPFDEMTKTLTAELQNAFSVDIQKEIYGK